MTPTWLSADSPVSAQGAFRNWVDVKSCSLCVISSLPATAPLRNRQNTCEFVNSPFLTVVSPLLWAPCIIHLLKAFPPWGAVGRVARWSVKPQLRKPLFPTAGTRSQPPRASAVCGLGRTEWDCRPVWGPRPALCQVGRAATARVFSRLISSGWAKPGWAARVIFASVQTEVL